MLGTLFCLEVRATSWSNFGAGGAFFCKKKSIIIGKLFSFQVRGAPWSNFGVGSAFSAICAIFVQK